MRLIQYTHPLGRELQNLNRVIDWAFPTLEQVRGQSVLGRVASYRETPEGYLLEVEIPGYGRDQVQLEYLEGKLTLRAEQKQSSENGDESRHALERVIRVPEDVAMEGVQARLENGILTVTLPRKESSKPARIEIQ
jgi:HSP20 family protein